MYQSSLVFLLCSVSYSSLFVVADHRSRVLAQERVQSISCIVKLLILHQPLQQRVHLPGGVHLDLDGCLVGAHRCEGVNRVKLEQAQREVALVRSHVPRLSSVSVSSCQMPSGVCANNDGQSTTSLESYQSFVGRSALTTIVVPLQPTANRGGLRLAFTCVHHRSWSGHAFYFL